MAENNKRTECVKVCFTEREFIDLGRLAAREDRKVADLVWVEIRRRMYGSVVVDAPPGQGTNED